MDALRLSPDDLWRMWNKWWWFGLCWSNLEDGMQILPSNYRYNSNGGVKASDSADTRVG